MYIDYKVKIQEDPMTLNYLVWIFVERERGKIDVLYPSLNKIKTFKMGEGATPSFKLPIGVLKPFSKALLELNTKLPEESFIEGKLKATEYHLEDLRKLLKLNKQHGKKEKK